jgi:two-component system, LytTR family, response regulator LytT
MSSVSLLIIEDEQPNANRLIRLLQAIRPNYTVLAVLQTVSESVQWLKNNPQPPLMLLDIRLADGICFDIFSQVSVTSPIIFTTAYDEYLMRAFKVNSIDYLLKPIDADELGQALTKFEQFPAAHTGQSQSGVDASGLYADLLGLYQRQLKSYRQRFLLPYRDGYVTLSIGAIAYFFSEAKITFAYLKEGGQTIVPHTLEELETELDPRIFFRANRQFIIHIDSIQSIHHFFNGKLKVIIGLQESVEIIISKDKAGLFKHWLNQ